MKWVSRMNTGWTVDHVSPESASLSWCGHLLLLLFEWPEVSKSCASLCHLILHLPRGHLCWLTFAAITSSHTWKSLHWKKLTSYVTFFVHPFIPILNSPCAFSFFSFDCAFLPLSFILYDNCLTIALDTGRGRKKAKTKTTIARTGRSLGLVLFSLDWVRLFRSHFFHHYLYHVWPLMQSSSQC